MLERLHHIAIISSDYTVSKNFYTQVLGFEIIREVYREDRQSYKLDLALNGLYVLELFSFPNPPQRVTLPESCGLRHMAFKVKNLEVSIQALNSKGISTEVIRIDEWTGHRFVFFKDPDDLPIELYE